MSRVEFYERIRKDNREGLSVRALAAKHHVHRRTVRQALASAVPPERKTPERTSPALGPWTTIIRSWLVADRELPGKQRHTARRVWQRLVAEYGAEVAESTVRAPDRRPVEDRRVAPQGEGRGPGLLPSRLYLGRPGRGRSGSVLAQEAWCAGDCHQALTPHSTERRKPCRRWESLIPLGKSRSQGGEIFGDRLGSDRRAPMTVRVRCPACGDAALLAGNRAGTFERHTESGGGIEPDRAGTPARSRGRSSALAGAPSRERCRMFRPEPIRTNNDEGGRRDRLRNLSVPTVSQER